MNKAVVITGILLGMTGIMIGAFAAHGLKDLITSESIQTFETGVKYQMYHALFLLVVGSIPMISTKLKTIILYLVVIGVIFFSGSIYGLATNDLSGFDFKTIGFVTPIGGLLLILAWIVLGIGVFKIDRDKFGK